MKAKIGKDKVLHFGGSTLGTIILGTFLDPLTAGGIMLGIGVGKEIFDSFQNNNKFDIKDIVADAAGIATGLSIGWRF